MQHARSHPSRRCQGRCVETSLSVSRLLLDSSLLPEPCKGADLQHILAVKASSASSKPPSSSVSHIEQSNCESHHAGLVLEWTSCAEGMGMEELAIRSNFPAGSMVPALLGIQTHSLIVQHAARGRFSMILFSPCFMFHVSRLWKSAL